MLSTISPPRACRGRARACWPAAGLAILLALVVVFPATHVGAAATADDTSNEVAVDRKTFSMKYPSNWSEDTKANDYDPEKNFTLKSPGKSYVQFDISNKSDDVDQVLKDAVFYLDGLAINTLSKTDIAEWGHFKGKGIHLKGKFPDNQPGGIRAFVFNSDHHNILVIELYYSSELKTVQGEIQFINDNFKMKE